MMRFVLAALAAFLLTAAAPDAFGRVLEALATADTPGARHAAARVLSDAGARPLDGTDLAKAWRAADEPPRPVWRNRALGPGYRVVTLRAGATMRFEQVFLAGQRARVAVVARPQTAVALEVSDDDGTPQCAAGEMPGRCDWVPLWTTRYRIDIENRGPRDAAYYVLMQ